MMLDARTSRWSINNQIGINSVPMLVLSISASPIKLINNSKLISVSSLAPCLGRQMRSEYLVVGIRHVLAQWACLATRFKS
jgi:hypothetical protein